MKKGIAALVFVVLVFGTMLIIANQRKADEEYKRSWAQSEREMRQVSADLDTEILAQKIRYVRARFNDVDASKYQLCHTYKPTTEEHKKQCEVLDRKVKKAEDEDAKHPW
jgi:hypothetical protein